MEPDGFIKWMSGYDFDETLLRLRQSIEQHEMTVFASIDHATSAASAALTLRPTTVLIFGSPKAGTPLMNEVPSIAIDLPLRALVWVDENGSTMLAYNDPGWIAARHAARPANPDALAAMRRALSTMAREVTVRDVSP